MKVGIKALAVYPILYVTANANRLVIPPYSDQLPYNISLAFSLLVSPAVSTRFSEARICGTETVCAVGAREYKVIQQNGFFIF